MEDDLLDIEAEILRMTEDTFRLVVAHMPALSAKTINALQLLLVEVPGKTRPSAAEVARKLNIQTSRLSESMRSFRDAHDKINKKYDFVELTVSVPRVFAPGIQAQEKFAIEKIYEVNPDLKNKPTRKE